MHPRRYRGNGHIATAESTGGMGLTADRPRRRPNVMTLQQMMRGQARTPADHPRFARRRDRAPGRTPSILFGRGGGRL